MSAYCANYEAQLSRRDDGRDAGSQPPRRLPTDLADDLERRRLLESLMSDRRGREPDVGDPGRHYVAEDVDRLRLQGVDWRDAELRRALVDDGSRYSTGAREADYEAALRMRDRLARETQEFDRTSRH